MPDQVRPVLGSGEGREGGNRTREKQQQQQIGLCRGWDPLSWVTSANMGPLVTYTSLLAVLWLELSQGEGNKQPL